MNFESILLDLEVIKQINENDKLAVSMLPGTTKLYVHQHNILMPIIRKYYGYNRDNTIDYLDKLFNSINQTCNELIEGNSKSRINSLEDSITNALPGLEKLKNTYTNDSVISGKITLYINKLKNNLIILKKFNNINILQIDNCTNSEA